MQTERDDLLRRARVLVADDHQRLLDRIVAILDGEFLVIGTARDGATLVEEEARLGPDLLVTDLCLPGLTGLEAAAHIRQRGSHAKIVCLSALTSPDVVEAAWEAGAACCVAKMSLVTDLVPAVRAALAGRRFVSKSLASPDPTAI
jgi:DNA-binding NarL/FixJ family response regulator